MSKSYLVRVEGTNLGSVLADTQDLSTVRGASLALLDIIGAIGGDLRRQADADPVTEITSGASVGLWQVDTDQATIDKIVDALRSRLADGDDEDALWRAVRHMTFTVEAVRQSEDFAADREKIIALGRFRQMQSPTVRVPDPGAVVPDIWPVLDVKAPARAAAKTVEKRLRAACELDLVRPIRSDEPERIHGESKFVSQAVLDRRAYGVMAKHAFYQRQLGTDYDTLPRDLFADPQRTHPFALNMASIAEGTAFSQVKLKAALQDKVAVFYADGNKFGNIQRKIVEDPTATDLGATAIDRQRRFDNDIKALRRGFLKALLELMVSEGGFGRPDAGEESEREALKTRRIDNLPDIITDRVIRLETLLWGGDELMFVMPARLGFDVAELFFRLTEGRDPTTGEQTGEPWRIHGEQLFHAAGLVFCHCDAPISGIRALAENLANACKRDDTGLGRSANGLAVLTLESFDHLGGDLQRFWEMRLPKNTEPRDMMLTPALLESLRDTARLLRDPEKGIARRRLRRMALTLHADAEGAETYEKALSDLERDYRDVVATVKNLSATLLHSHRGPTPEADANGVDQRTDSIKPVVWLMLEELWDYFEVADMAVAGSRG